VEEHELLLERVGCQGSDFFVKKCWKKFCEVISGQGGGRAMVRAWIKSGECSLAAALVVREVARPILGRFEHLTDVGVPP